MSDEDEVVPCDHCSAPTVATPPESFCRKCTLAIDLEYAQNALSDATAECHSLRAQLREAQAIHVRQMADAGAEIGTARRFSRAWKAYAKVMYRARLRGSAYTELDMQFNLAAERTRAERAEAQRDALAAALMGARVYISEATTCFVCDATFGDEPRFYCEDCTIDPEEDGGDRPYPPDSAELIKNIDRALTSLSSAEPTPDKERP